MTSNSCSNLVFHLHAFTYTLFCLRLLLFELITDFIYYARSYITTYITGLVLTPYITPANTHAGFAVRVLAITLSNARGASTGCTGDVLANKVGGLLQTLCFDVAGAWVLRGVYMYRQMRRFM